MTKKKRTKKKKPTYCIGCGIKGNKPHFSMCPIKYEVKIKSLFGISFRPKDLEYNLNLARISIFSAVKIRDDGLMHVYPPENPGLSEKEFTASIERLIAGIQYFCIERADMTIKKSEGKLLSKKKIERMKELKKLAKKLPEILNSYNQKKIFETFTEIARLCSDVVIIKDKK